MSLFPPPPLAGGLITPRPYQEEAFEALDLHISTKDSNPCVVLPTGSGKSYVIAMTIQRWKAAFQPLRVCILAHRKELVSQNHAELVEIWPEGDIGIYAAGLGRKDEEHSVIYASIDSIYNKWGNFAPFDIIIVDEAHRIPAKGEGKYREFIKGCRISNKNLRVIGFTATPYRMGCGPICHKDHILNEVCYEANVGDLIAQGFLCKLRSKMGDVQPDLTNVKRNSGGDYIESSLAAAIDTDDLVSRTIKSVMETLIRERRKSVLFFCVDMDHCKRVSAELRKYGVDAPYVTAKTPHHERDRISEGFKTGRYKALCSINVFSEGFNAKRVDAVVLLRPTLSVGLYYQQVGRGLRLHDSKTDCLILDYAHCIQEHGPIDCIEAGDGYARIADGRFRKRKSSGPRRWSAKRRCTKRRPAKPRFLACSRRMWMFRMWHATATRSPAHLTPSASSIVAVFRAIGNGSASIMAGSRKRRRDDGGASGSDGKRPRPSPWIAPSRICF
jgi:DNA repair protein RadD